MKSIVLSISPQSGRAAYVPVMLFNTCHLCLLLYLVSESWRLIRFRTDLVCKPSTKVMYLYPNYRFFFSFHILSAIIITATIGSCKKLKNSNLFHISALARICRQRKTVTNLFVSLEPQSCGKGNTNASLFLFLTNSQNNEPTCLFFSKNDE